MREVDVPVENPGLVRWMLLLGQLGKTRYSLKRILHEMYSLFLRARIIEG